MINGILRDILRLLFAMMARSIAWDNRRSRRTFRKRYAFFYGKNAIATFPVAGFDEQKERLRQVYDKMAPPKSWAETSGTTSEPKLVPYDLKRKRLLQKTFFRSMITLTRPFPGRKTFFVFASLGSDKSLTSGMMEETKTPSRMELLQAPYRYFQTPEGKLLIERVGELTARVMVLIVTQPRFLYATNPSTLSYFLKELDLRWKEVRVRLKNVPPGLMKLSDTNGERLMMTFLIRDKAPTIKELLPDLAAVITWDGGYVSPFLEQLKLAIPGIPFIPMYSMSTETIETLPHRVDGKLHFLPVARGLYPEFADQENGKVVTPFETEKGKIYELIMNDEWGLRRYATNDLFEVVDMIDGVPDLVFKKRKGLTSSLTGEKLTEDHVRELFTRIAGKYPAFSNVPQTVYPVSENGEIGYELAFIRRVEIPAELGEFAEKALEDINSEYKSKVRSKRLRPLGFAILSEQHLATLMGKETFWESQFKVLPLYDKLITR